MDKKKSLYIYIVTIGTGTTSIDSLREVLHEASGVRAKAFVKNPQTFVIHAETDISELLSQNGFAFTVETYDVELWGNL
ncbi:MAG: hypothetical protein A3D57_03285 [Candidatus Sungbacteria bacterium RIFCSPHIGHO2_02_FULL_46_12]|nr:MAG: hypothetical protein A3D57_03285 [Candidatus Sungbacteria bacterium RIFCSPHIGHO2_02_FULL_46_12]